MPLTDKTYTTERGNVVRFGTRGWIYETRNVPYTILSQEQNEIWKKWGDWINKRGFC